MGTSMSRTGEPSVSVVTSAPTAGSNRFAEVRPAVTRTFASIDTNTASSQTPSSPGHEQALLWPAEPDRSMRTSSWAAFAILEAVLSANHGRTCRTVR